LLRGISADAKANVAASRGGKAKAGGSKKESKKRK